VGCKYLSKLLAPLLAGVVLLSPIAWAESGNDDLKGKTYYEFWEQDGVMYRLDKRTGRVEKLKVTPRGVEAIEVPFTTASKQGPYAPEVKQNSEEPKATGEMAQLGEVSKKADSGPIALWDEKGNDITDQITDAERQAAQADIAAYDKDLSKTLWINSGERLSGTIMVRNNGGRHIQALELTLAVPVNDKEKPIEYSFFYSDKAGLINPPQPGGKAGEGEPLLQKLDLPLPAGGVKEKVNPELKITYIKFRDK